MDLHVLPPRTAGAAENMAADLLLLQRYPGPAAVRFRHYEWRAPAFTFGLSQKIAFIRAALPPDEIFDLCRRPTGGGLVDHRDDWTYALVVPRGHPLEEMRASASYRATHECLAAALKRQGVPAITKAACEPAEDGAGCVATGVCFQRAELYDVVRSDTGEKIAGAAQKRNKHGLLFQGSIWRPAVGAVLDWEQFHDDFSAALATALAVEAAPTPWPEFAEDELSGLTETYSSPEWIEAR